MRTIFWSKLLVFLAFLCCTAQVLSAQSSNAVNVSLTIAPPYPVYVEDLVKFKGQTIVNLVNLGSTPLQVKLITSISSDQGIGIQVKPGYQPTAPILLGAQQTRVLTGSQLSSLNANLNDQHLTTQGISLSSLLQTETLPEGVYTICVRAYDYNTGAPLSPEMSGCATIVITHYDPPVVILPAHESYVEPVNPQFLMFNWTPAGLAGITRYRLELIDLTLTNLANPNDAFETPGVLPFYKKDNLTAPTFPYDLTMPKLSAGHQYAVRVTAYDPSAKLMFKNGGKSPVSTFWYKKAGNGLGGPGDLAGNPGSGGSGGEGNNEPDPPNGDCVSATKWNGALSAVPQSGLPNGTDIKVGYFVMKNTVFTQNGNSYSGTGEILVNFLNTKLKVEFSNIQVNADHRFYSGKITAKVGAQSLVNDAMSKTRDGLIESVPDAEGLMSEVEKNARRISKLLPEGPPADLPLGLDNADGSLAIVGVVFEPTEAYLNTVLAMDIPQAAIPDWLNISQKGIPFHPNGFGAASVKIALAKDKTIALSDKFSLQFTGGADKTYVELDCEGFNGLQVAGAVVLDRKAALPVDASGNVIQDPNVKVKAAFTVQTADAHDWMIDGLAFSHKFAVPDAPDFVITAGTAVFDFSAQANNADFEAAFPAQKGKKDWIGLYISELSLRMPKGFKKDGGAAIDLGVQHFCIDKMGVSGTFSAEGQPLAKGSVAGWGFELDEIDLVVKSSALSGGGFGGVIQLPLGEKTKLGFDASVSKGDANGANISITLETKNKLDADLFLARISLYENSSVTIARKDGVFEANATLHGKIGIGFDKQPSNCNVSNMKIPDLEFQSLTIDGRDQANYVPKFDLKFVALANFDGIQAKIGNSFELDLNKLEFKKSGDGKSVGLTIGMGISLFGGENNQSSGAGGGTDFTIWAKHQGKYFAFDKATLGKIKIDADVSVARLKGEIEIFSQDDTYGNGFRGSVDAQVAGLNAGLKVTVQFGRTLPNKGNFKYWYFDAMIDMPNPGLPIPGTVAAFYGFGGGAWWNMSRAGSDGMLPPNGYKPKAGGKDGAPTFSGATYTPSKGTAGFTASVLFGMAGTKQAFNGDVKFTMEFNAQNLSVNFIRLDGNFYVMQNPVKPREPGGAMVYAGGFLEVNPQNRSFYGALTVNLNVAKIITGGGSLAFKFKLPQKDGNGNVQNEDGLKWYVKVGYWTPGANPFDDPNRLHAQIGFDASVVKLNVKFQTYFMVGNDLPDGLPPLPTYIVSMFNEQGDDVPAKQALPAEVAMPQSLAFAWGAGLQLNAGFDFFIVSADFQAEACLDVLLADVNATCDGEEIGFSGGWYVKGQAYAYIHGSGKFLRIPIVELAAAAILQVEAPNPTWIRGDVVMYLDILGHEAGKYHGSFERGERCKGGVDTDLDPFATTKLIKSAKPANNAKDINPLAPEIGAEFYYKNDEWVNFYNPVKGYDDTYKFECSARLLDANNKEVPLVKSQWGNYSNKITVKPESNLLPNTSYKLEVNARFLFLDGGNWVTEKTEQRIVNFKTGAQPETITDNLVLDAYPLPNQRYAMRQYSNGNPMNGFMVMKYDLTYLKGSTQEKLIARITELGTNKVWNQDCSIAEQDNSKSTRIQYAFPAAMSGSKFYEVKILRKNTQTNAEKTIYAGYTFRTSKYVGMKQKIESYQLAKVSYLHYPVFVSYPIGGQSAKNTSDMYVPVVLLTGGENFEHYDLYIQQSGAYNGWHWDLTGFAFVDNPDQSEWMYSMKQRYRNFATPSTPELSVAERGYLQSLDPIGEVTRPAGFPYEGIQEAAFYGHTDAVWMQNFAQYESMLKQNNGLAGNESLLRPDGPLTAAEIAAAKSGGMGGGLPLGNGGKSYVPVMDFTVYTAFHDKVKSDLNLLKQAPDNKKWSVFQSLDKLGWPKLPAAQQTNMWGDGGFGSAKTFNWQYKPPMNAGGNIKMN